MAAFKVHSGCCVSEYEARRGLGLKKQNAVRCGLRTFKRDDDGTGMNRGPHSSWEAMAGGIQGFKAS